MREEVREEESNKKYCICCGKEMDCIGFFCLFCWLSFREKEKDSVTSRFEILDL